MYVSVGKWRRGFGFVFLQISEKNGGTARVSAFTTDTVHHSAVSFGTTPNADHVLELIKLYLSNIEQVESGLLILMKNHHTTKHVSTPRKEIVFVK